MEIRKGMLAAMAFAGILCLTGCTAPAQNGGTTAEPTATADLFYVDVQVPYVTQQPAPTSELHASDDGTYISISSEGRVTVQQDGWDSLGEADATVGYFAQLREGDTGSDVEKLQRRLQELGYYAGEITGTFDTATKEALMAFESRHSDASYGIATVKLQQLLFSEEAAAKDEKIEPINDEAYAAQGYIDLQFGAQGSEVIILQQRLMELGYFAGDMTGTYDYYTSLAVMRYEAAYRRELTGVATIAMQESLFAEDAREMGSKADKCDDGWFMPLKKGDDGADVALMQQRLSDLGYADDAPNGKFNTFTTNLLKEFQENCGLKANGRATEETLERLYAFDAPRAQRTAEE